MSNIITAKTPSGSTVLLLSDGEGGVVYRQLNGELYTGSCNNLQIDCCDDIYSAVSVDITTDPVTSTTLKGADLDIQEDLTLTTPGFTIILPEPLDNYIVLISKWWDMDVISSPPVAYDVVLKNQNGFSIRMEQPLNFDFIIYKF